MVMLPLLHSIRTKIFGLDCPPYLHSAERKVGRNIERGKETRSDDFGESKNEEKKKGDA